MVEPALCGFSAFKLAIRRVGARHQGSRAVGNARRSVWGQSFACYGVRGWHSGLSGVLGGVSALRLRETTLVSTWAYHALLVADLVGATE